MQRRHFITQVTGALAFGFTPGPGNSLFSVNDLTGERSAAYLQPIAFADIRIGGTLYQRVMKNLDRLEEEKYHPEKVFITGISDSGWPGDTEGRTLLGLTMDAQASHRKPKYLQEIISLYPQKSNSQGYMGEIEPAQVFSEQQLASHGWMLRGFCEYYQWKKDAQVLSYIKNIVNHLALPTAGYNRLYPIDAARRKHEGSFAGNERIDVVDHWKLSSDTGATYIFLDGLTQAYTIVPSPQLKAVIDEMIDRFLQIDVVAIKAQTHATLTSLRSLLRWYEITGRRELLSAVIDRYKQYRSEAMTENYENYNWFGRPEWTEPCAVIDSFIVATQLWRFTGESAYLEDAHHIYFNGLELEQRSNGGFGLQNCTGAKEADAKVVLDEAHWCCTMRGGEGLSRAVQYAIFSDIKTVVIPFYHDCEVDLHFGGKKLVLKETTSYPDAGKVELKVLQNDLTFTPSLKLFAPTWSSRHRLAVNSRAVAFRREKGFIVFTQHLKKGDVINLEFDQALTSVAAMNKHTMRGYHSLRYGPLILSYEAKDEIAINRNAKIIRRNTNDFEVEGEGIILHPLRHLMSAEVTKERDFRRQILFKDKS